MPREAREIGDINDLSGSMIRLYNKYVISLLNVTYPDCRMDDLLRAPEHAEELLSYRAQTLTADDSSKNTRALTLLQGSIQSDLQELREKRGQVSRDDATKVMMKMMFLRRLEQQHQQTGPSEETPQTNGVAQGNQNEAQAQVEPHPADSVGCTAVSVLITPTSFISVNAGDSRAVLCRGGEAMALSHDHKPNDEVEHARITRAGGTVEESQGGARTHYRVNGNLNLSRAIGDLEYKKNPNLLPAEQIITSTPDVFQLGRTPDDEFMIIACDGVWDVLSNEDAVQLVRTRLADGKSLDEICEEVADECLSPDPKATQGIGADNITCVIVDLREISTSS